MLEILTLLVFSVFLAFQADTERNRSGTAGNLRALIIAILLAILLAVFMGTRSSYGDTVRYVGQFFRLSAIPPDIFSMNLGDNPGFNIFLYLLSLISSDSSWFLFSVSLLIEVSFVLFFYRYSQNFALSIFLFISSPLFLFTATGVKQSLAMAIGIWSVPLIAKRRVAAPLALLCVASLFHPYVAVFALAFVLFGRVLSKRVLLITVVSLSVVALIEQLAPYMQSFISLFGEKYSTSEILGGTSDFVKGVNIFRWCFYLIPPILILMNRRQVDISSDSFIKISCNFSIISFLFMTIALVSNPQFLGRMADYFFPFTIVALCFIVREKYEQKGVSVIKASIVAAFSIFLLMSVYTINPDPFASIMGHW